MGVRGALYSRLWARMSEDLRKSRRKYRRSKRKTEYKKYLESPAWKEIRAQVLRRDKYKCRACDDRATVVHHVRYPMKLGEEKLEWLYSLCAPCHDTIHAIKGVTLREATAMVLSGMIPKEKITYLADDPGLSRRASAKRQGKRRRKKKPQVRLRQVSPAHLTANERKVRMLETANSELHEIQRRARENRQARLDAIATRESIATLASEYGFRPRST